MVRIADNANIASNSVVKHFANVEEDHPELTGATDLEWPGENYLKAAALVWFFLRQEATRQDAEKMAGDDDRPGWIVKGVSHKDAIQMLWPTMPRSDFNRAQQGVAKFLKLGGNYLTLQKAVVVKQRGQVTGGEYWVADSWVTPENVTIKRVEPAGTPRPERGARNGNTDGFDRFAAHNEQLTVVAEEPQAPPLSEVESQLTETTTEINEFELLTLFKPEMLKILSTDQLLNIMTNVQQLIGERVSNSVIDDVVKQNDELRQENRDLGEKLSAIRKAIGQ